MSSDSPFRYDRYRGVISLVNVQQGVIRKGDRVVSSHTKKKYEVIDVGIMHPEEISTGSLHPGQVGFIACNMKESSEGTCLPLNSLHKLTYFLLLIAHIGDTLHHVGQPVESMPGFKPTKAMVRSVSHGRRSEILKIFTGVCWSFPD